MNIFVTSNDPVRCAKLLDNRRLVKMVLETAQLLSTAVTTCGGYAPYKPTHLNHPCCIWTRASKGNYNWLLNHFVALCNEYTVRYNKTHKCHSFLELLECGIDAIPEGELTPFVNCTPHKLLPVHDAYAKTLLDKWMADKRPPKWGDSLVPPDSHGA